MYVDIVISNVFNLNKKISFLSFFLSLHDWLFKKITKVQESNMTDGHCGIFVLQMYIMNT